MLRNSFQFIPRVGEKTERDLWNRGIISWEKLLDMIDDIHLNGLSTDDVRKHISNAERALVLDDAEFFQDRLPNSEVWRIYPEFRKDTVFLDIESTGLSKIYNETTVITTYSEGDLRFFIKGGNLDGFVDYISEFEVLVTYNGKWFDVPFLKEDLNSLSDGDMPPVHIDLRPLTQSMGLNGGLSNVESQLGIERLDEITEFDGKDATRLWSEFIYGDDEAVQKLINYNIADTVHLEAILSEYANWRLSQLSEEIYPQQKLAVDGGSVSENYGSTFLSEYIEKLEQETLPSESKIFDLEFDKPSESEVSLVYSGGEITIDRDKARGIEIGLDPVLNMLDPEPVSMGIDLSASEKAPTGICILRGNTARVKTVHKSEEILQIVRGSDAQIVSIDSPLSLPRGRCCTSEDCECEKHGIIRECERELKSRGVNTYPCLIDSMRDLTKRGLNLASELEGSGMEVIESYPGAAQDIIGIPRKGVGVQVLEEGLRRTGLEVENKRAGAMNNDELDAMTSALVGHFYMADLHEMIGREDTGIVVPDIEKLQEATKRCQLA